MKLDIFMTKNINPAITVSMHQTFKSSEKQNGGRWVTKRGFHSIKVNQITLDNMLMMAKHVWSTQLLAAPVVVIWTYPLKGLNGSVSGGDGVTRLVGPVLGIFSANSPPRDVTGTRSGSSSTSLSIALLYTRPSHIEDDKLRCNDPTRYD